jgi:hypothetical protein
LDGELVRWGPDGLSNLGAILKRHHLTHPARIAQASQSQPVCYVVFDLLYLRGRSLLGGGTDQKGRFRAVSRPLEGTPEQIMVWVEVVTGMTLDGDVVDFLNAAQWQERRQRLEELGGLPMIEQEITPLRK